MHCACVLSTVISAMLGNTDMLFFIIGDQMLGDFSFSKRMHIDACLWVGVSSFVFI